MQMLGFANDRSREFNQNLNQSLGVERAKIRGEQPTLADLRADKYITDEMANAVMGGMTAWHGSPHTFNKFDMSKIGTGEGAQAYGHGLYLAENPEVAKSYQHKLTVGENYVNGKVLNTDNPNHLLASALSDAKGSANPENDALESLKDMANFGGSKSIKSNALAAIDLFNKGERPKVQYIKPEGSLYLSLIHI